MNYYIQGDAANADKIKAAFEKLGYHAGSWDYGDELFFFFSMNNGYIRAQRFPASNKDYEACLIDIIKTHPDYQELPVEPLFKVGDWIVQNDNGTVSQITKVINDTDEYGEYHAYEHTNGYFAACFENEFHLWSIADAKDGDVLVTTTIRICPFIYRKTSYKNNLAYYYAGIDGNGNFCEGCTKRTLSHFGPVADVVPATKEQRDRLFSKMKEAGCQWDVDKKELRKIKPHYDIANFKPFDKVLVRDGKEPWRADFFEEYDDNFYCFRGAWEQCIPFNGDTKHLLGTTEMCPQEYINW